MQSFRRKRKVGLLGGSFNPAHEGHLHISEEALKRLDLDEIWWLVSPQNPLKSRAGMATLDDRMAQARAMACRNRRIRVTDIETRLGTTHTARTLALLQARYRRIRFVWLMGADNLIQIPAWKDWHKIFILTPIAVFTRPTYDSRALVGKAARCFRRGRLQTTASRKLARCQTPVWAFLRFRRHTASATEIRKRGGGAFRDETGRRRAP